MISVGDSRRSAVRGAGSELAPGARFCAVIVAVALLVPANLALAGPLGGVGSAVPILGLLALGLVILTFLRQEAARAVWNGRSIGWTVAPSVIVMYVIVIVGLYGASYRRLMDAAEVAGGTRALLSTLALAGAALAVGSFITDSRGLRAIMGCIVAGVGFSAIVGALQTQFPLNLAETLRLPGFVVTRQFTIGVRNDLTRAIGSAAHPIEFTVILACAVPFALYVATYASTKGKRQASAFAALLLLATIPLGVSRSGILGVAVALLCYSVVWTWRQRWTALAVALAGLVFYRIVQPGVLGTIAGLFTNAGTDTSIEARTTDYPLVEELLVGKELLGIGPGTFQPDVYFILDNQYLVSYVEGGIVGVIAFSSIPTIGLVVALMARRRAVEKSVRDAAQAVFAGIAALAACAATFDVLAFLQVSFLLFVFVGLASAILHIASREGAATNDRTMNGAVVDSQGVARSGVSER